MCFLHGFLAAVTILVAYAKMFLMKNSVVKKSFWLKIWFSLKTGIKRPTFMVFVAYFILILVAFIGFLNQTIICDNVVRMGVYEKMSLPEFIKEGTTAPNGRWGNVLFYFIYNPLSHLGFNYENNQWIFFVIDFIILAISLTLLYSIFSKLIPLRKKYMKVLLFMVLALIVVNPFMVESLAFMIPNHSHTLLAVSLAIYFLVSPKKRHLIWTALFSTLAICTYQSYYSTLLLLGVVALFLENKQKIDKKLLKQLFVLFAIIALGVVIWLVSVKVYGKVFHVSEIKGTSLSMAPLALLKRLLRACSLAFSELLCGSGIYKTYGILYFVFFALGAWLIVGYAIKRELSKVLFVCVFMVVSAILPVAYSVVASYFYVAPRTLLPYFAVLVCLALLCLSNIKTDRCSIVMILGIGLFLGINIFHISGMITDIQISNKIELSEVSLIAERIRRYEEKGKYSINTIIVYCTGNNGKIAFDIAHTNHPDGFNSSHHLTATDWSDVALLSRFMGRNFEQIEEIIDEEKAKKKFPNYSNDNMNEILSRFDPDERLVFDKNVMYWITY